MTKQKRFRYKKVTPKIEEEIKRLRKSGMPCKRISEKFRVSKSCIYYHTNPKERKRAIENSLKFYNKLSKTQKREKERKRLKYKVAYYKNRYNNDEEFRKRVISQIIAYQKRKKARGKKQRK